MPLLAELPSRPARASHGPLRPSDPVWRARNGNMQDDLGPIFPIRDLRYAGSKASAVQMQDDGSGFVFYPSGNKAISLTVTHRGRRVAGILFADHEFAVPVSASSLLATPKPAKGAPEDDEAELVGPTRRTRYLGALNDWGLGLFESVPDSVGTCRCAYEVTSEIVRVKDASGNEVKVPRSSASSLKAEGESLRLRLNAELTVWYDVQHGHTVIEFAKNGIQQTFHVGEVWRTPLPSRLGLGIESTTPLEICRAIPLETQALLDTSKDSLVEIKALKATLRMAPGFTRTRLDGVADTTLLPSGISMLQALPKSSSAPILVSLSGGGDKLWQSELEMKKAVLEMNPILPRSRINKKLSDGYTIFRGPIPKAPSEPVVIDVPSTVETVTSDYVLQLVQRYKEKTVLLVVLVVADWASGSVYNSCMHARTVCESAYGILKANPSQADSVHFVSTDLTEAGAIHSCTRRPHPLVEKFGIKNAPWMLMFQKGECVYNQRPTLESVEGTRRLPGVDIEGGLGFAMRLREQPSLARPRVLVLEPALDGSLKTANIFRSQLETQDVLRRSGFQFDMALSAVDAQKLAGTADPPYGMFVCNSEAGASVFTDIADELALRREGVVGIILHDKKGLGDIDASMRDLGQKVHAILHRPLSRSALDKVLWPVKAVRTKYPKVGMTSETIVDLIQRKLG